MKKLLLLFVIALAIFTFTNAQTPIQSNLWKVYLSANNSIKVFSNLTWVSYMKELKATKVETPKVATKATLDIILDKIGTTKLNFKKNTFTITVGYTSCKVNQYVNWRELPKKVSIDLTNVDCIGKPNINFLPLLKKGQRIAVFFAKINGSTHDWVITFN